KMDDIHCQNQITPCKFDLFRLNDFDTAQAPASSHLSPQPEAHLIAKIPMISLACLLLDQDRFQPFFCQSSCCCGLAFSDWGRGTFSTHRLRFITLLMPS